MPEEQKQFFFLSSCNYLVPPWGHDHPNERVKEKDFHSLQGPKDKGFPYICTFLKDLSSPSN